MMEVEFINITYWHWFVFGLLLLILEVLGAGGFLLWIGGAALITGIVSWFSPGLDWYIQFLFFSIFAVANSIFWWQYLKRNPLKTNRPQLNRRSEQYIGRTFILIEPIKNGYGKIKVGDSEWRVSSKHDLPVDIKVIVTDVDGVILLVKPYEKD